MTQHSFYGSKVSFVGDFDLDNNEILRSGILVRIVDNMAWIIPADSFFQDQRGVQTFHKSWIRGEVA